VRILRTTDYSSASPTWLLRSLVSFVDLCVLPMGRPTPLWEHLVDDMHTKVFWEGTVSI